MSTSAVERLMSDLKRLQQDAPPGISGALADPLMMILCFGTLLLLVFGDGSICLDMLDLKWNPDYDVVAFLATIQLMLGDPNPFSPANQEAATMLIERRIDYYKKAQRIVELSWKAA